MDSGLFNMFGLAPAMPCAFSRVLKNWDTPVALTAPEPNLELNRFEGTESKGTTVYQIPINSTEHYLLEYRGERQINVDSVLFVMSEGREDLPTYLEVLRAYIPDRITISDSTGVLLKMDNYDWGLPGAGILIWHIDESVIREKGPENRINDDRSGRAVDVEEADGSQDIGYSYSLVEAGFQSELGTWLDFWFEGNPSPLYINEFSGKSAPNTFSNWNFSPSNIIVDNFSDNYAASMRFSFHREFFKTGFPVHLNLKDAASGTGDIYFVPVESVDKPAVFVNSGDGDVFAATDNGKGLFDQQDPRIISGTGENGLSIVFADTNTNGAYDMLVTVTPAGLVSGYRLIDQDNDGSPDSLFAVDLQRSVRARPVVRYPYVFIGAENGEIFRLHFDGRIDQTLQTGAPISGFVVFGPEDILVVPTDGDGFFQTPNVIDMDSDGIQDTVYFENARSLKITSGTLDVTIPADEETTGQPAFADLDLDGFYEILFTTSKGVHAYKYNGARVTNFPLFPVLGDGESVLGTPLILDLDADGACDVAFATTAGRIYVYSQTGDLFQGLPFSTGSAMTGSPAAGDIDGDLRFELFGVNGSDLYAWEFPGELDASISTWTQAAYDPSNNHLIDRFLAKVPSPIEELLPPGMAFVYPNPNVENYTNIRYYLNKDARVTVSIFDLAGDLVTRFDGPGNGAVDNEVRWQLDGVSSGVYLCRIEAAAEGEQAIRLIKVMVIK
jgi:hypothetical protein